MEKGLYSLPNNGFYKMLLKMSLSTSLYLMLEPESEISKKVFESGLINYDQLKDFYEEIKDKEGDEFEVDEQELMLIYTCHYIANCFAQDKEAFFKWFMLHDNGQVANSEKLRLITMNGHKGATRVFEERDFWDEKMEQRKLFLENLFGELQEGDEFEV
ncbi:hypothetical protein LBMAG27_18120 [Bacteroidota bacterium]|nr:hypothetical protein LBMAG27_18120 [Bacteroidota bacterium]